MKSCQATLRAAAMMAACAGLGAPLAHTQDRYGTASTSNYVLQAYEFVPFTGPSTNALVNGFGSRGCFGVCVSYVAPAMLPAGAVILAMELEACDTSATNSVGATLFRQTQLEGAQSSLASGFTSTTGCQFVNANLPVPHTVNNETGTYFVQVGTGSDINTTRFQAVRIVYRLQVSPAPATATFPNDVPTTHPFFRFVQALAAAGITGGCGTGSYCPNSPVTRGEMAVFLATALGLHFPN